MASSVQTFLNFAADHAALLEDLFRRKKIAEGDLLALIRLSSRRDATDQRVLDQLVKLGFVEPSAEGDAFYELTWPVASLLGFLIRQQTLTSAVVIQAYVEEMQQLADDLERSTTERNAGMALRVLSELESAVERLRDSARRNRETLTAEAVAMKSDDGRRAVERYEIINRLWTRYLVPLREILDPDRAMDGALDRLDRSIAGGIEAFREDGPIVQAIHNKRLRMTRLRREVARDHHESVQEVEPLYRKLRHETQILRGATLALESVTSGEGRFAVDAWLALPKREGGSALLHETAIEAYLHGVRDYVPVAPGPVPEATDADIEPPILPDELRDRLRSHAPIADVMGWLLIQYADRDLATILDAYGSIFGDEFGSVQTPDDRPTVNHRHRGFNIEGRPIALAEVP